MKLNLLHTSDWHLGIELKDFDRTLEHRMFLTWLHGALAEHAIDVVLITGDVFDHGQPSAEALRLWFGFLVAATRDHPHLQVVVIAGNHDSPQRLTMADPLLAALGRIHVVGAWHDDLQPLPLYERSGAVAGWLGPVPYLRSAELAGADPLGKVRAIYATMAQRLAAVTREGQAQVLTGHCFVQTATLSPNSERNTIVGTLEAWPVDVFPAVQYVALGHLHRAQTVRAAQVVRYAGSPLPLAFDERNYAHQAVVVQLNGAEQAQMQTVTVPRAIGILCIPDSGEFAPWPLVQVELAKLPLATGDRTLWPLLEVRVSADGAPLHLRQEVEALLADRAVRMISLRHHAEGAGDIGDGALETLEELGPLEVVRRMYAATPGSELADAQEATVHTLIDLAQRLQMGQLEDVRQEREAWLAARKMELQVLAAAGE